MGDRRGVTTVGPVEKLRRRWSSEREVVETVHALDPATELDSMLRDWLHRICEQHGPQTVKLGVGSDLLPNTGELRFEIVHFEPSPGVAGVREVSLWVEGADPHPALIPHVMDTLYPRGRRRR